MNIGDIGVQIRLNTSFNLAAYTSLSLILISPSGVVLTRTAILGTTAITNPDGSVYAANQWVYYDTVSADISVVGTWTARVVYTDSSDTFHSNLVSFAVGG